MSKKLLFFVVLSVLVAAVVQNVVWADSGPEHKTSQPWPIKLGTSGSNINDTSSLYCCSGTLGALVEDGSRQYILSNNHVLAQSNQGIIGDGINQPGMIDQGCGQAGVVASLSDFVDIRFKKGRSIPLNTVDAAIAVVVDGAVDPNGGILDIGQISSEIAIAELGQAVQKSGRTTGHTRGVVTAIGVTVDVGYSKECGGASNQIARFTDQIFIEDGTEAFSAGGDSGSLVVEDADTSPRAIGLLFAGNSTITVANPIDAVLGVFGVVVPGGTISDPEPMLTGSITGTVINRSTGAAIDGAVISTDTGESTVTQANGGYLLSDVPVGDRQVTASASGFRDQAKTTVVVADAAVTVDLSLKPREGGGDGRGKPNSGAIRRALKAKNRYANKLLSIDGVVGAGVGLSEEGRPVVQIYLSEDSSKVKKQIPSKLDDVAVETVVTGTFQAF
ncbi:MAG: carboxypeptidase regulatory-like domain-containing protein [Phycisphaerae bacterium]|nr:carboxypeptidase regulatory-like domain-containing protein [Phycisphaerae bacterium]